MSKPVTNEEVEDVLSSIRRLVSEDKRPLAGLSSAPRELATPAPAEREAEPAAERLVLTPALRVAEATEQKAAPLDLGSVARETWMQPDEAADDVDDGVAAEPTTQNSEPDEMMDALDALVQETLETQPQADDNPHEDDDYSDESYWKDEDDSAAAGAKSDISDEAGSSPVEIEDRQNHLSDDFDWNDHLPKQPDFTDEEAQADDETGDEAFFEPDQDEPDTQNINFGDLRAASVPLKATIAALGAAIGKTRQEWEPDGEASDELAAADTSAMVWEDDVDLDANGAPLDADEIDAIPEADEVLEDTPIGAAFGSDDQVIDEEALRDLVSEIVRSELQGALGERITRNVRKLVRREIHRALTAQEME